MPQFAASKKKPPFPGLFCAAPDFEVFGLAATDSCWPLTFSRLDVPYRGTCGSSVSGDTSSAVRHSARNPNFRRNHREFRRNPLVYEVGGCQISAGQRLRLLRARGLGVCRYSYPNPSGTCPNPGLFFLFFSLGDGGGLFLQSGENVPPSSFAG